MKYLIMTFTALALMIWAWAEFFRAIPNLEEAGVLKNFQVQSKEPLTATFSILDKRYYRAGHSFVHPSAPVRGGFQHLEYVSNIDLLLSPSEQVSAIKAQVAWEQDKRCFNLSARAGTHVDLDKISAQLLSLSIIAKNEDVANQLRRIKAGQTIELQGHWAQVQSAKTSASFLAALGHVYSARCQLFVLNNVRVIAE